MVNSSFHTENCWTYLGREAMTQAPYLCMPSALDWYLSAGLTSGELSCPMWSRGADRGFVVFLGVGTALLRAVVAMHREAWIEGLAGLKAAARALFRQILVAIVYRDGLDDQLIEGYTSGLDD